MIPKPGPNPPNHPENRLFDPNFTFGVPKSHKNPGVGGSHIWENFPKKRSFYGFPECTTTLARAEEAENGGWEHVAVR